MTVEGPYFGWRHINTIVKAYDETTEQPVSFPTFDLAQQSPENNYNGVAIGKNGNQQGEFKYGFWTKQTGSLTTTIISIRKTGYTYNPTVTSKTIYIQ